METFCFMQLDRDNKNVILQYCDFKFDVRYFHFNIAKKKKKIHVSMNF